MKVEQLKAELVVFKGLMSNVSSACHTWAPLGYSGSWKQKGGLTSSGLLLCCPVCHSFPHFAVPLAFPPWYPLIQAKKEQKPCILTERQDGLVTSGVVGSENTASGTSLSRF